MHIAVTVCCSGGAVILAMIAGLRSTWRDPRHGRMRPPLPPSILYWRVRVYYSATAVSESMTNIRRPMKAIILSVEVERAVKHRVGVLGASPGIAHCLALPPLRLAQIWIWAAARSLSPLSAPDTLPH